MPKSKKISIDVPLPKDFIDFMRTVAAQIEQGDYSAIIESDDLLQCESAFGGLYDSTAMRYGFTYFPEGDSQPTWDIDLSKAEVISIAQGQIKHLRLWRCLDVSCRCLHPSGQAYCSNCDDPHDYL